jgi:exodeoxyribonuclease-3
VTILRLLSYNIRHGGVGREDLLVEAIRSCDPDLVVLQEATRPAVVARLAEATGMSVWGARPEESVGFMTRFAVAGYVWRRPEWSRRGFLAVELADGSLRVVGVHLTAVHSNWTERLRARELRAILGHLSRFDRRPTVVAGDFNTLAPGELLDLRRLPRTYRIIARLSGREIRWTTIQLMLQANYVDGFRHVRGGDPGFTFPTWDPHVRLDYIFLPAAQAHVLTACRVVTDAREAVHASDHFPLLAELDLSRCRDGRARMDLDSNAPR